MKHTPLEKSPFSLHFNILRVMGAWVVKPDDEKLVNIHSAYRVFMTALALSGCYLLFVDLYLVLGDFNKMTWNLCVTTLFFGGVMKNIISIQKCQIINKLRVGLHNDTRARSFGEDEAINATALRELKFVRMSFYGTACVFVPLWLIIRYNSHLWGRRQLPLPLRIPVEFDLENDEQYNYIFAAFAIGGIAGISLVIENEIAMFGILIQISREYSRLLKDIPKINELFLHYSFQSELKMFQQEVNPCLRNLKTKKLVKEFSSRQQKLIEYTENFENCYNKTMVLQVFAMSLLVIVSSIQVLIQSTDFSVNISYQMGYNFILVVDLYLVCYLATRLREQCFHVGEKIYCTLWYRMDVDIQKDIRMIIMRSQRPPKITSGKIMELNLNTFMLVLRNIYSWLTLYKQLEMKVTND